MSSRHWWSLYCEVLIACCSDHGIPLVSDSCPTTCHYSCMDTISVYNAVWLWCSVSAMAVAPLDSRTCPVLLVSGCDVVLRQWQLPRCLPLYSRTCAVLLVSGCDVVLRQWQLPRCLPLDSRTCAVLLCSAAAMAVAPLSPT